MSADGSKLAVIDKPGKVHTSEDFGATWTERTSVAMRPWDWIASSADGNTIIISADASSSMGGVAFSTDAGSNWTELDTGDFGPVAVSDDGTHLAYYDPGEDNVMLSTDGGDTWDAAYEVTGYATGIDLSADGGKMVVLDSGGANVMLTTNSQVATTVIDNNGALFDVVMDTTGDKIAIAGSGDYGILTSEDFGETWVPGDMTDGLDLRGIAADYSGDRLLAAGEQRLWVNVGPPEIEDYNGDEIPDADQPNLSSYLSPITGKRVVIDVGENCEITTDDIDSESALATQDAGYSYDNGLFDFAGDCGDPGFETTMKLYYYGVSKDNLVLRKYNPQTHAFATLTAEHGVTIDQTTIHGETVTVASYRLVDGGALDLDGTVNGQFEDPIGLAASIVIVPNTGLK